MGPAERRGAGPRDPGPGRRWSIAVVAAVLLFRLHWSVLRTLGVCALLGIAAALVGLPLT